MVVSHYLLFLPLFGEMIQKKQHIFQMGGKKPPTTQPQVGSSQMNMTWCMVTPTFSALEDKSCGKAKGMMATKPVFFFRIIFRFEF